jgi:RTX calcium-binding nonapeptide repeat (4 copies)
LRRCTLIATATLALGLLAPAAAQAAATIGYDQGNNLVFTADPSGSITHLAWREYQTQGGGTDFFPAFAIPGNQTTNFDSQNCIDDGVGYIACNPGNRTRFQGGNGLDSFFVVEEYPTNLPVDIIGAGGNDKLDDQHGDANRTIDGGTGNDRLDGRGGNDVLLGGDGNDELEGHTGADELRAGGGDDTLFGDPYDNKSPDILDGGPGFDKTEPRSDNVNLTMDGQANDFGEGDNIFDVEYFAVFGNAVGTIEMTQARDKVEFFGDNATIRGLGGDDELVAGNGTENIDGGPGSDTLTAGFNHDTITGGPGPDNINADVSGSYCGIFSCQFPFGNDTVHAADGEADQIECGVGNDTANVDARDVVNGCEVVNRIDVGPGPGPGGTLGLTLSIRGQRLLAALARGLRVRAGCRRPCRLNGAFLVDNGLLARPVVVARGRKTLRRAGRTTLVLKFTRRAKRKLRRFRRVRGTVRLRATPLRGGRATTRRKRVTLRR